MSNHLGREGTLKISSTTYGELRNYTLNHTSDTVEDTVIGDTYRTRKATLKDWSVSGDVYWDPEDAGQQLTTVGSTVTVNLYPMGIASAATYYTGACIVTQLDVTARHDSMVEGTFSGQGTTVLTISGV